MTKGAERLRGWLHRSRRTQQELADELGVHFTYVSKLVLGSRPPSLAIAVRLEAIAGIPVNAWAASVRGKSAKAAESKPASFS